MVLFSNLKTWDKENKTFSIQDIEIVDEIHAFSSNIKEIDCSNLIAIPSGIDIHVHFRQPGFEHKETMKTGSLASLSGGVTTVLDMPNTNPVTDSIDTINIKRKFAKQQKYVEILIASAITNRNYKNLREIDEICDAYKVFMSESFGNLMIDNAKIYESLAELEKLESKKPVIFHAEDPEILAYHNKEKEHFKQRPPEAEASAIQQVLLWAQEFKNCKFHITHVSSSLSLKFLEMTETANLTSDTCPRYLWFDQDSKIPDELKKVNPPLRNPIDKSLLLDALATGIVDIISSDHSPHTMQEKLKEKLSGMPGVQELLPSILSMVLRNEIEWERTIEAIHTLPSKLLNINNNNGDLVIFNPNEKYEVNKEWIKSKSKWSPFEGHTFLGKIMYVTKENRLISKT
jgi:dihydroorotase